MNKMEPMQASILNYYTDAAYRGHFFCTKDRDRKSHLQGQEDALQNAKCCAYLGRAPSYLTPAEFIFLREFPLILTHCFGLLRQQNGSRQCMISPVSVALFLVSKCVSSVIVLLPRSKQHTCTDTYSQTHAHT